MKGKIIRGIAGFYYVYTSESGIFQCKAKGIFRKLGIKPLVGDDVELEITDERDMEGNITAILPRRSSLIRPAVANVDSALVIFACRAPDPNYNLLDRFLLYMGHQKLDTVICFNKCDLISGEEKEEIKSIYRDSGKRLIFTSAKEGNGLSQLSELLEGRTTAVAGPSGAGKSTLINLLQDNVQMETGDISRRTERGKHTTRHAELIALGRGSFIVDTPGFSSLLLPEMEKEEVRDYYPEFSLYEPECRFSGCSHIGEKDCGVKTAVSSGGIHGSRYETYCQIYEEIKERGRY